MAECVRGMVYGGQSGWDTEACRFDFAKPERCDAFGRVDAMSATIANYVGDLEQAFPVGLGRSLRCTIDRFERTS